MDVVYKTSLLGVINRLDFVWTSMTTLLGYTQLNLPFYDIIGLDMMPWLHCGNELLNRAGAHLVCVELSADVDNEQW